MSKPSTPGRPTDGREIRRSLTPAQKFSQEMQNFAGMSARVAGMAALLAPILIFSLLMLDLPVRLLNGVFSVMPGLTPTQWLTWGRVILALVPLVAILFARRYGGEETSRALVTAWFILALFVLFELSVLSSVIEDGDFPGSRYMIALVASAMTGQLVSVALYDVMRGSGQWWRVPFYASLAGYFVTILIYFPIAYWENKNPWGVWMVGDMMVKTMIATAFLPFYYILRKKLRPRGGYGAL